MFNGPLMSTVSKIRSHLIFGRFLLLIKTPKILFVFHVAALEPFDNDVYKNNLKLAKIRKKTWENSGKFIEIFHTFSFY